MEQRNRDLLKSYAVLAVGPEGVTLKLLETLWYRRAVRAFNEAKASGRWMIVQVRLGDRVCVTCRMDPEPHAEPSPPAAAAPREPRTPASRPRPLA